MQQQQQQQQLWLHLRAVFLWQSHTFTINKKRTQEQKGPKKITSKPLAQASYSSFHASCYRRLFPHGQKKVTLATDKISRPVPRPRRHFLFFSFRERERESNARTQKKKLWLKLPLSDGEREEEKRSNYFNYPLLLLFSLTATTPICVQVRAYRVVRNKKKKSLLRTYIHKLIKP